MAIEGTKGKMQGEREEEEKKKAKSRHRRIEPWIVSYILSLASLVPYAIVG